MPRRGERRVSTREHQLTRTFVELADTLVDDFDVVELLSRLGERCVHLFDAASAGVLLVDDQGVLRLMAATSEAVELVELFQLQNSEGPCFDCFRTGEPVEVDDLVAASDRWPRLVPIATSAGFRSAHAFPMRLRGQVLGALNLFRTTTGGLSEADVEAAQALTDVATIAILQQRAAREGQLISQQLNLALNSRVAIEQAKGVVAEHCGVDMEEASTRLRGYASRSKRLLGEVAQELVTKKLSADELSVTT